MAPVIPPGVVNNARRTIASSLLGSKMTWTHYSYETKGAFSEVVGIIKPGYSNPPHHHTLFKEIFTATRGTLTVNLDGKEMQLKPGDSATVEIGHVHSLINASDEDVEYAATLEPGHEGFEQGMYIVHGLANDGLTNDDGVPKNPTHAASLVYLMDTWLAGWLWWIATPLLATMRRTGQGLGADARLLRKYWE